jgi:glycosyltransferase involved in cell wall biosynthesis
VKKKIKGLMVLPSIWSMGKGTGMPSVHNLLKVVDENFGAIIITQDSFCEASDYPSSILIRVPRLSLFWSSRYINFIMGRLNYWWVSCVAFVVGWKYRREIGFLYLNSAVPIMWAFGLIFNLPVVHRMYGTFLFPHLGSFLEKLKRYEEVLLFRMPASAYVITDDGTRGDKVAAHYGVPSEKVYFWRNGINDVPLPDFSWREALGLSDDTVLFASTCRLTSWKRVDRCIRAFMEVKDSNIRLLIAGSGEDAPKLKEMAQTDDRIIFLGHMTADMAAKLVFDSNVYITLHDYSNVGNPLLEALRMGVPVLTCATGDTARIVRSGESGVCVSMTSETELIAEISRQIELLSTDGMLRKNLADGALTFGREHLQTWNERVAREILMIGNLMSEPPQVAGK